jgi:hypothetical protein
MDDITVDPRLAELMERVDRIKCMQDASVDLYEALKKLSEVSDELVRDCELGGSTRTSRNRVNAAIMSAQAALAKADGK